MNQVNNPFLFQNFFFNNFFFNPNLFFLMNHNLLMNNTYINTNYNININIGEPYNIYETENELYIESIKHVEALKISRSIPIKFEKIKNSQNAIPKEIKKKSKAFAIIGIIDLYHINYLGYVSSSEEAATIFGPIYKINSIELIKINNTEENANFLNLKENIKKYFSTNNLYYSIEYKIALPISHFNRSIINNNKYLINYNLLKPFFDNNIPYYFYCQIIFGYVSEEKNIFIGDNNLNRELDMIIIERYINGNIIPNNDVLVYIKQIEFITVFKNKNDPNKNNKFFSYVFYESNESIKNLISFYPFKLTIVEELNKFKEIVCIIKNIKVNELIEKERLIKKMEPYNHNYLNNKIKYFSFVSEWGGIYFGDIKELNKYLNSYSDNIIQKYTLWFININNNNFEHKRLFYSIIEIFWRSIQKQINNQILDINIGILNPENTNLIFNRFSKLADRYINNFENKKPLLKEYKNIFEKVSDDFLNIDNKRTKINLNLKDIDTNPENLNKLKLLCATWNVGGSALPEDYEFLELFTKNHFYLSGQSPDIVLISIQEIVPLKVKKGLFLKNKEDYFDNLTESFISSLNIIFPGQCYIKATDIKMAGIYVLLIVKVDVMSEILFKDIPEDTKKKSSTLTKGFLTLAFQYKGKIFSIASGNKLKIQTLIEILNKDINIESQIFNKFKDSDFWIILGDFDFSLDLSYEYAISLIQDKNYKALYDRDQFHLALEQPENIFLKKTINEGEINFAPTYKLEKNSDDYEYDSERTIVPSYCDRILFCKNNGIMVLSYERVSTLKFSNHRPVSGAFMFYWYKKENDKKKEEKNEFNEFEIMNKNEE